jgi:hypothetical protein
MQADVALVVGLHGSYMYGTGMDIVGSMARKAEAKAHTY